MTTDESIVKALQARLADLTRRVGDIDSELRKPLSADFSEQAAELENQDALGAIENSELQEIHQIQVALKRIDEGTYGDLRQLRRTNRPQASQGAADRDQMHRVCHVRPRRHSGRLA